MEYAPSVPSVTLIVKELSKTNSSIEDSSPSCKRTTLSPGRTAPPSTLTSVGLCSSTTEGVSCTLSDAAVGVALAAQSWEATGARAVSSRSPAAIRTTIPAVLWKLPFSVSPLVAGARCVSTDYSPQVPQRRVPVIGVFFPFSYRNRSHAKIYQVPF